MHSRPERLVVLTSVYDLDQYAYLSKLKTVIERMGIPAEFWCWDRNSESSGCDRVAHQIERLPLMKGGGENNRGLLLWYPLWIARVFVKMLFSSKDALYFCSNLDTALPVALASSLSYRSFIFANRDNVSKSYRWPTFMKRIIERLEVFTARRAGVHLLPGRSRWPYDDENVGIIPNTPTQSALSKAKELASVRGYAPGDKLTVYVNGWLTETRGVRTLLEAIKQLEKGTIKVVVAGPSHCRAADDLMEHDDVTYLGTLPNEEALAVYFNTHLAFTYYDPDIEINRLAEPNKWQDCIATGTPFVVNSEVVTAKTYIENGACFAVPYHDSEALAGLLRKLSCDRSHWVAAQKALSAFDAPAWDDAIGQLLSDQLSLETAVTAIDNDVRRESESTLEKVI